MDTLLLLLVLTAQAADATYTCRGLHNGTLREVNPVYGHTCARVVAVKVVGTGLILQLPQREQRWLLGAWATGGAVGLGLTWKFGHKDQD